jgi:hypothetical protein
MPLSVAETTDLYLDGEDYTPEMREVSGELCIAQRLLRRWTTPKGFFPWWPNAGEDVRECLLDKAPLWQIKVKLEAEGVQDEAVDSVFVNPSLEQDGTYLVLEGWFACKLGTFKFSMGITEAAGNLIALQRAA